MSNIDLNKLEQKTKKVETAKSKEGGAFDFLNKDIKFFDSGFNDKKKERFYSELCILFNSGVDIRSALELIEEEQLKEKDKIIFSKIKEAIVAGASLSKAVEQTGMFTAYEFYSIQ